MSHIGPVVDVSITGSPSESPKISAAHLVKSGVRTAVSRSAMTAVGVMGVTARAPAPESRAAADDAGGSGTSSGRERPTHPATAAAVNRTTDDGRRKTDNGQDIAKRLPS